MGLYRSTRLGGSWAQIPSQVDAQSNHTEEDDPVIKAVHIIRE